MTPVVLAVTGLNKEARIAAGPGIAVVAGGGSRAALEARLTALDARQLRAVVSFGIAGALDPGIRVGDVVLATEIRTADESWHVPGSLLQAWRSRLGEADFAVVECPMTGIDAPLLTPAAKAAVWEQSGAGAVDMESHVAAAFATRHGLPFGAIRVVSDRADHVLPPIAGLAMRPDGSVDVVGVMRSLARSPGQIPALVATARDAAVAFRRLGRVRRLLGLGGGSLGLDL